MASRAAQRAMGVGFALVSLVSLGLFCTYLETQCARQADGTLDCVERRVMIGGIPLGQPRTLAEIRAFDLEENCTDDYDGPTCSWWLEYKTAAGVEDAGDSYGRPEAATAALEALLDGRETSARVDNFNAWLTILGLLFGTLTTSLCAYWLISGRFPRADSDSTW